MRVSIYGIGYVGLVQAAVLADAGHQVCCVDIDEFKIDQLKQGVVPIHEPGLAEIVKRNLADKRLIFTTDAKQGVDFAELQFIAVGTPEDKDGSADLKYVLTVARTIAEYMQSPKLIINKSTVPVGTADKVRSCVSLSLDERDLDIQFDVISNPEFLKEGDAVNDCKRPDRIIVGTDSVQSQDMMRELYAPFNRNHEKIIVMDVRSAELTKYAANCMLATKISFMNEMANIAERVGADIELVRHGIGSDNRIGYQFIYPGCGYGGCCFPKDVKALVKSADEIGYNSEILKAVEAVNMRQKMRLYDYICEYYQVGDNKNLSGKTFALWGLSFKPNTDDMREAPSRILMELLWQQGAKIQAYDPEAMDEAQRSYGDRDDIILCGTKEQALKGADALVICTEWQNFKAPDFDFIAEQLSEAILFDGRNLFDPDRMAKKGFIYYSIGRNPNFVDFEIQSRSESLVLECA